MAVLVVAAALSVGAWWVVHHSVQQQNEALLKSDLGQIVLTFQEALETQGSALADVGLATVKSGNSPAVFATVAKGFVASPGSSLAIVDDAVTPPRVLLAAGSNLHQGEQLSGDLAAAVSKAGPLLSSVPLIHIGTKIFLVVTEVPPTTTGTVMLYMSEENPYKATSGGSGPYKNLDVDVYATPSPQPGQLYSSNTGGRPLPKPTVSEQLKVDALDMDFVAAARGSLVGGGAEATPWIVLSVGLAFSIALAIAVEVLVRRQRHTALVVAETRRELLEVQASLVRQERLSAVGQMATVIGHELRNPLAATINALFLVRHKVADTADPELERYLSRAEFETNRAAALSEDLTSYMRERRPHIVHLDLRAVIDDVLQSAPPPAGITVSAPDPGIPIDADKDQIIQVLINLLTNAYQATPGTGSVSITGSEADGFTEVVVQDTGHGIDQDVAGHLFDPFVTTKPTGIGLGLAIVSRIVEAHAGTVTAENGPAGGARVALRIPRSQEKQQ